jgi:phospholipid/cholesterol/gamma-HCH transport system substrate-binding protein
VETKVNYAIVGAFVLVLAAAVVGGVLWLGSGGPHRKDYAGYVAYFTESVSGLNLRATVRDRGVEAGSVREISLDPANPERVRVLMEIERRVPIKEDSVATLAVQGLTGITHIELSGGSNTSPLLRAIDSGYPEIKTAPSFMLSLDQSASVLIRNVDQVAQRLNGILDEPTQASFQRTIANLDKVTASLAARSSDVEATLAATARTTENAARASAELPALIEQIARTASALEAMGNEVGRAGTETREAAGEIQRSVQGASSEVRRLGAETVPTLNDLLVQMQEAAASLNRVTSELERNPNALVLGKAARPPGPGE